MYFVMDGMAPVIVSVCGLCHCFLLSDDLYIAFSIQKEKYVIQFCCGSAPIRQALNNIPYFSSFEQLLKSAAERVPTYQSKTTLMSPISVVTFKVFFADVLLTAMLPDTLFPSMETDPISVLNS